MAETHQGVVRAVAVVLRSAAAGFSLGEAALAAAEPVLTRADGPLLSTVARGGAGVAGVGAVAACLASTAVLVSTGTGLLLSARVMGWLQKVVGRQGRRVTETAGGVIVAAGAVAAGTLAGVLPARAYLLAQCVAVPVAYPYARADETTVAVCVVFAALFLGVVCGRTGVATGLVGMGVAAFCLCALLKVLSERPSARRGTAEGTGRSSSQRSLLYSIVAATLGFLIGVGAGGGGGGSEEAEEVTVMLGSVLWVGALAAGVLGAALGTVAVSCLGPGGAGRVALGAAATSSAALRLVIPACALIGEGGGVGGLLGGAAAAGVSVGAAGVAAQAEFGSAETTWVVLGSVAAGAVLGSGGLALGTVALGPAELMTVSLVAVGAFTLGAPKSPFHTQVRLRGEGVLMGTDLMGRVGMETVTAALAPLGAGALGAAGLATAALGRLGTVGVLGAVLVALGKTACGVGETGRTVGERD